MDDELRRLEREWRERGDAPAREAYAQALRRSGRDRLLFVYRSGYEGPNRKRIVRLDGVQGPLEWFRNACETARAWGAGGEGGEGMQLFEAAGDLVDKQLGGGVYGLGSVFEALVEKQLATPTNWAELAELLQKNLYVEGEVTVEEPTVRALTDDDEVTLAYYFLPESHALLHPDRTEYLLLEDWQLPIDAAGTPGFEARVSTALVDAPGAGPGATWIVSLADQDSGFLSDLEDYPAAALLPGVRLPGLAAHLRQVEADGQWPDVLLALRAALGENDTDLTAALERCRQHGVERLAGVSREGSWADMRAALARAWPELSAGQQRARPDLARISAAPHVLQLSTCRDWSHGSFSCHYYDQWILFDDLWAAAHPDLALSLLRYATQWDPLA